MNDTPEKNVDAESFHHLLMKKIGGKAVEGKQIKGYLDAVLPDWKDMTPTHLYKNIYSMLDDAKKNRQFEAQQTWKRVFYSFILLFPFFVVFSYFTIIWVIGEYDGFGGGFGEGFRSVHLSILQEIILLSLIIINFFLSQVLLVISSGGFKQQENWKNHIEYLQEILGIRFLRLSLRSETFISFEYAHHIILKFVTFSWFFIFYFFMFQIILTYNDLGIFLELLIGIPLLLSFLICIIWVALLIFRMLSLSIIIIYSFIKEGRKDRNGLNRDVNMHHLKDFDFDLLETTDANSQSAKSYFSKLMSLVRNVTF